MEQIIQHLAEGQQKLQWAMEGQLTAAQSDRELLKEIMKAQTEAIVKTGEEGGLSGGMTRSTRQHSSRRVPSKVYTRGRP